MQDSDDERIKSANIYGLTRKKMKAADKIGLRGVFDSMIGKEKELMLKAMREKKWDLCIEVFEFASYRYFQKQVMGEMK